MPTRLAEIQRNVAGNVRRLRLRAGMTQELLAQASKVAPRFLQALEAGKTNLTLASLVSVANALDVEPGRLLRRAPAPARKPGRPAKKRLRDPLR